MRTTPMATVSKRLLLSIHSTNLIAKKLGQYSITRNTNIGSGITSYFHGIWQDIRSHIDHHRPFIEIRHPPFELDNSGTCWHCDCGGTSERIFVWASVCPTEARVKSTKQPIPIKSGEIWLLNNLVLEHRGPAGNKKTRWFVVVRFSLKDSYSTHTGT